MSVSPPGPVVVVVSIYVYALPPATAAFLPRPWPHRARNISTPFSLFVPHLVLALELVLREGEPPQLPAQLEGGQDGVLGGEGDERGGGQGAVGVDPGPRVAEAVLGPRGHALFTAASGRKESAGKDSCRSSQIGNMAPHFMRARPFRGNRPYFPLFSAALHLHPIASPSSSPFSNESRALPISTAEEEAPL